MKKLRWLAVLAVFMLVAAACGDSDSEDTTTTTSATGTGGTETTQASDTTMTDVDLSGTDVSVFGAFTSVEATAVNKIISDDFNASTGVNAVYEGSDSFEEQIKIRTEGGNPPDVALYPQPGSVIEQAELGNAIALEDLGFEIAELNALFGEYYMSLGEYEGKHYGLPTNANLKSLVWYAKPVFDAEGYAIPATWDELTALSQQMIADGYTPWCIGTGSDAATGWPATDWMEDIMLRTAGADLYDQWVTNELKFASPEVTRAAELLGGVVFAEDNILGEAGQVPAIDFRDAPDPMFNDPPACLMHRQASFIVNFFPDNAVVGENVAVFAFPDIDEGKKGALIAGELGAVFADRPEVQAWIRWFISAETQCAMGSEEGVTRISPNVNVASTCYADPVTAVAAEAITAALVAGGARFDASDLMPSAVGSGSFWTGMNEYMQQGPDSLPTILTAIDNSWP